MTFREFIDHFDLGDELFDLEPEYEDMSPIISDQQENWVNGHHSMAEFLDRE
jgi:hypothetical protein